MILFLIQLVTLFIPIHDTQLHYGKLMSKVIHFGTNKIISFGLGLHDVRLRGVVIWNHEPFFFLTLIESSGAIENAWIGL